MIMPPLLAMPFNVSPLCCAYWDEEQKWEKQQALQMEIIKLHKRQLEGGHLIIPNSK